VPLSTRRDRRRPDAGEQVPLLQIVPSKSNEERLFVSPELASVLVTIVTRLRRLHCGALRW